MLGDVLWVDVMHSETPDKSGPEDRGLKSAPCIAGPVEHAGDPVDEELGADEAEYDGEGISIVE